MQQSFHFFLLLFITAIIYSLFLSTDAHSFEFPSANISTKWINRNYEILTTLYQNGVITRHVLLRNTSGIEFSCGFICPVGSDPFASCKSFLFSIFLNYDAVTPQTVWSANRERLVRENATLEFSKNGDLVLRDFDGTLVWSTATSGKSVVGMELNEVASLVLFYKKNNTNWSSMDYPTDSLVLGQTLQLGQRLTANVSPTNSSQGPFATTCKQACLANYSCKGAIFQYDDTDASNGSCYQLLELYSLINIVPKNDGYNSSAFIKVQSFPNTSSIFSAINANVSKCKKVSTRIIVAASVGALLCFLTAKCVIAFVMRRHSYREGEDGDEFDMLPGLPTRFAFEDLRAATNDFLRKLGEGGFGSVFEGTLINGTKIAVKKLNGIGQGTKEFLSEVETIGSINHIHLVRLIGFCAEKFSRLLVYEYMSNGSLDKWIFYKDRGIILDWQTRRKIINDIAKGLAYLHDDCRQKIVHLDIKPQNILLDENFNAKVSDFGLAKLINRDQIEVMTRMRGTPGYLAPEWLTSVITEKVDVFSFGVVVLEIVCGRRNLDHSKDEEDFHLIGVLQRKIEENKLVDMLDCRCTSMQTNIKDVIMIMHLAMWCLQSDSNKRPLMSVVLKVLEGSMNVEADLDYDFLSTTLRVSRNANIVESMQPIPSILSGPR